MTGALSGGGQKGGVGPVAVVIVLGGALVVFFLAKGQSSTTSSGVDPNAVAAQNAIVNANANALTIGAQERVQLATIAGSIATTHDNNQTTIAVAQNNGATQVELASLAAQSTYASALMDTIKSIEATLSTAQTAQYHDYVTGQTAQINANAATNMAGIAANSATTIATTNAAANTTVGLAQANATVQVAGSQSQAATAIGEAQAQAAINASNNATAAQINSANQAASASKSRSMWSAIGGVVSSILPFSRAATPSGTGTYTFDNAGNLVDSSEIAMPTATFAPGIGGVNFTNFGLPTLSGV